MSFGVTITTLNGDKFFAIVTAFSPVRAVEKALDECGYEMNQIDTRFFTVQYRRQ